MLNTKYAQITSARASPSVFTENIATVIQSKCGIEESDLFPWLLCTVLAF